MRVVVTAQRSGMDAPVDPRFGRSACLMVIDTETGSFEAVDNHVNLNAAQGAGVQAAQKVAELKAAALVTGQVGPKAFRALSAGGIAVYAGASGTVKEALDSFQAGRLRQVDTATVDGHWM